MAKRNGRHIRICGVGRSGSTVVGAYLAGRLRGGVHVGEIVRLATETGRESKSTWTCSCGKGLEECEFWGDREFFKNQKSYREVVGSLIGPGCIIVDTSKTFPEGVDADIDIHLVKDPRATSWSWFRTRSIRFVAWEESLKRIRWFELPRHVLYEYKWFIKYRYQRTPMVSYESFVAEPERTLQWVSAKLGVAVLDQYNEEANHGIGGNIARYAFDGRLVNEQGWRDEAPFAFKVLTTIAYAPILLYLKSVKWRL